MKTGRLGGLLLGTGVAVGVAAVIGLVTGFEPSRLPATLIDIAVYKLTFAAAGGLLAAGAVVRRYARREANDRPGRLVPPVNTGAPRLPGAQPADFAAKRQEPADVRVPDQR